MKSTSVSLKHGGLLPVRVAVEIVRSARSFTSVIRVRCRGQVADARSILSLLTLCASMGAPLRIEAMGDDEDAAVAAVQTILSADPLKAGAGPRVGL